MAGHCCFWSDRLFKHVIRGWLQLSHIAGIVARSAGLFASGLSPLMLSLLTTAIMIITRPGSISLKSARSSPA
jgi:hypothetical protein